MDAGEGIKNVKNRIIVLNLSAVSVQGALFIFNFFFCIIDQCKIAVWAHCQGLVFHSSDRLADELWETGERLWLRVPLLWRRSWADQDLQ